MLISYPDLPGHAKITFQCKKRSGYEILKGHAIDMRNVSTVNINVHSILNLLNC